MTTEGTRINQKTESSNPTPWGPRNRQWWSARILCVGLLAIALTGYWAVRQKSGVIRTPRLEIVTADGKVCGSFGATIKGNPELALNDKDGNKRATFTTWDGGTPSVTFYDANGVVRSSLDVTPAGKSVLRLSSNKGSVRVAMEVGKNGNSIVRFADQYGVNVAALTVRDDGTPEFHAVNREIRATANAAKPMSRSAADLVANAPRSSPRGAPEKRLATKSGERIALLPGDIVAE